MEPRQKDPSRLEGEAVEDMATRRTRAGPAAAVAPMLSLPRLVCAFARRSFDQDKNPLVEINLTLSDRALRMGQRRRQPEQERIAHDRRRSRARFEDSGDGLDSWSDGRFRIVRAHKFSDGFF